jgi:hypothetical protein
MNSPLLSDGAMLHAASTTTTTSTQIEKGKNQLKGKTVLRRFFHSLFGD